MASRLVFVLKFDVADTSECHLAGWSWRRLGVKGDEVGLDSHGWIEGPVVESREVLPIGFWDGALGVLAKERVLMVSEPRQAGGIWRTLAQINK